MCYCTFSKRFDDVSLSLEYYLPYILFRHRKASIPSSLPPSEFLKNSPKWTGLLILDEEEVCFVISQFAHGISFNDSPLGGDSGANRIAKVRSSATGPRSGVLENFHIYGRIPLCCGEFERRCPHRNPAGQKLCVADVSKHCRAQMCRLAFYNKNVRLGRVIRKLFLTRGEIFCSDRKMWTKIHSQFVSTKTIVTLRVKRCSRLKYIDTIITVHQCDDESHIMVDS